MTEIILCGCNGKMGKNISAIASQTEDFSVVAGVDVFAESETRFPVFKSFGNMREYPGAVIIDFSHPSVLQNLLSYAIKHKNPCVICTTGLSENDVVKIKKASEKIPIFYSGNMSIGINLLISLAKTAAKTLGSDFDIEIIEKHHNLKLDAPSGTAFMIANAVNESNEHKYIYDRHNVRKRRDKKEIGIHSVRGGTIVGEHEIIFAGNDEVITVSHSAQSKTVFAQGAIRASEFLKDKKSGMYDMNDMIRSKI